MSNFSVESIDVFMKFILFICCFGLFACRTTKVTGVSETLSILKTECGSYEINRNGKVLGYSVKPMYIKFENEMEDTRNEIQEFENLIIKDYSTYYDNSLRVYHFTTNRDKDTVLIVTMLTLKQSEFIPNWRCEYQDVDTYYKNKYRHKFAKKHPDTFYFNSSKKQFKNASDPD